MNLTFTRGSYSIQAIYQTELMGEATPSEDSQNKHSDLNLKSLNSQVIRVWTQKRLRWTVTVFIAGLHFLEHVT